ncbi:DNA polymerase III subunit alpha [Nocardioides rubriscoriae]|uniref:DNA polymerase III subunit alpha n=1 Tax=Nocardioides rubriscoriae TaxID=642762 RepID=UPI0011DF93DE|nr:DNA polymerase III subunit alpha [Nocardioides rubriscoriae]
MPDPFVHLHVASGFSLQYGATHPHALVARAAEQEMDTLALTDRDGAYGAVRFARACQAARLRTVLGVDLAYRTASITPTPTTATARTRIPAPGPARGGTHRDRPLERGGLARVTVLASADTRGGRAGWAALCRLVSAVHLAGERGRPVLDLADPALLEAAGVGDLLASGDLVVLLGPASELGPAVTRRRDDHALAALAPWRALVPSTHLVVEVVSHRLPGTGRGRQDWGPGSTPHAARMAGLARRLGLPAVLTNAVRHAERRDAVTVDVLDAARRLVALDLRHLERRNAEGYLKSGKEMSDVADEVARAAGLGERGGLDLLARTRGLAERCVLDPRADLGLGEVHFPEVDTHPDGHSLDRVLRERCEAAIGRCYGTAPRQRIWKRLDDELETIRTLGYAAYFLTVADVTDLVRERGIRCAARGSGAGSLVNHLLGVSGVDPLRHGLLMERFLSPLRDALPDIDVDVESARRLEVYETVLDRFGGERCVTVSMMDTYRVRHAVRDVGAALGMPPGEVDAIATSFPHIRARDARAALRDLPELRAAGLGEQRLDLFFDLVERLDGLPRHVAMHPCGVLLSDRTLLDRTPVEASFAGFPMSQFDKDDVEDLGLLKLDVLGIRMQSAMAHAVAEVRRVDGVELDLDDEAQVPFDDPATYSLISSAHTLGVFQIESPGQRELIGKSGIDDFGEIITDISLFRPGPVQSDMITPYLDVKHGWRRASYLHDDLRPVLEQTHGVVVFHEQVIEMIAILTGCSLAEGDEKRRALGSRDGMEQTRLWFFPRALGRGYDLAVVERVWEVVAAFASFGFCKAHAAAFALPTYQSAWLKTHWPAHFLAGVLTHDPGMYPKRLILDDVRRLGIEVRGLDVDRSEQAYVVEPTTADARHPYAVRVALSEVKGISAAEVERVVAARPYASLTDFWHRARVSRPVVERLVLAGGFDRVYGIDTTSGLAARGRVTRRDLLLQVADLDRFGRALERAGRGRGLAGRRVARTARPADERAADSAARNSSDPSARATTADLERHPWGDGGVWARASAQGRSTPPPPSTTSVQLSLDLGDAPQEGLVSGLPELTAAESTAAELEILGLDVTRHVVDGYAGLLDALGVTRSRDLLRRRSGSELLVAGVKVATQTPPIRSGRRVVFLTLDDATGPVDATFFEDAQGPYARTVFGSWLLVVRGVLRRTGHRGVSVRATGAWELSELHARWRTHGTEAVLDLIAAAPRPGRGGHDDGAPVTRRALVHSSGFALSPYADVRPAGDAVASGPARVDRALWHRSPGSPG